MGSHEFSDLNIWCSEYFGLKVKDTGSLIEEQYFLDPQENSFPTQLLMKNWHVVVSWWIKSSTAGRLITNYFTLKQMSSWLSLFSKYSSLPARPMFQYLAVILKVLICIFFSGDIFSCINSLIFFPFNLFFLKQYFRYLTLWIDPMICFSLPVCPTFHLYYSDLISGQFLLYAPNLFICLKNFCSRRKDPLLYFWWFLFFSFK